MQKQAIGATGPGDRTDADGAALERELETARERLAFYEGFDRLIQENIARSGDLMREAIAQRETAAREAARARAELDRRLDEQRATLSGLGDDLVALQERAGALARRVIAALDDLTDVPAFPALTPAPAEHSPAPPADADASRGTGGTLAADAASVPPGGDLPAGTGAGVDAAPADPAPASVVFFPPPATVTPSTSSGPPAAPTPSAPAPEPGAVDGASPVAAEQPRSVAVVVHGVPRAAAALSLQRHLAGLAAVEAVEAREYAGGVLRLQIEARGPLAVDDLRGWEEGAGLEPVHVLPGVIEVKLPGAAGP